MEGIFGRSGFVEVTGKMPGIFVPDGWIRRGLPEGILNAPVIPPWCLDLHPIGG